MGAFLEIGMWAGVLLVVTGIVGWVFVRYDEATKPPDSKLRADVDTWYERRPRGIPNVPRKKDTV